MKKLLLILLCVPLIGLGQENDAINIKKEVDDINYRMNMHYQQYSTGMILTTIGVISTTVGANTGNKSLLIPGGIVSVIGSFIIWDSHKWFGSKKKKNNRAYKIIKKRKFELKSLYNSGKISQKEYEDAINNLEKIKNK